MRWIVSRCKGRRIPIPLSTSCSHAYCMFFREGLAQALIVLYKYKYQCASTTLNAYCIQWGRIGHTALVFYYIVRMHIITKYTHTVRIPIPLSTSRSRAYCISSARAPPKHRLSCIITVLIHTVYIAGCAGLAQAVSVL